MDCNHATLCFRGKQPPAADQRKRIHDTDICIFARAAVAPLRWYKRDPDAALAGMLMLNLEQRGAYNTLIDLMYASTNRLHDDDRFISGWLRVDPRVWRRLKSELIQAGKIFIEDGFVRNFRVTSEVTTALTRGVASPQLEASQPPKSLREFSENNDLPLSEPKYGKNALLKRENKNREGEEQTALAADAEAPHPTRRQEKNRRGSRIADDWQPQPDDMSYGTEIGLTPQQVAYEFEKFMDYWRAQPGSKGLKLDWDGTFRNWLRRAADDQANKTQQHFGFNGRGRH